MKVYNWIYLLACLFVALSSCDNDSTPVSPSNPEPELLLDSYVYMSTLPGTCGMELRSNFFEHTWHLCVHAPDTNSVGAYFWIEPYDFGPEDSVTITPADGVSYEGDLFTGMTISWDASSFEHESILTMSFIDNPPSRNDWYSLIAKFHDSELFLENGRSVYLEDAGVLYIYCGHYGGGTLFRRPDSFIVQSGKDEIITFKGIGSSPGLFAAGGMYAIDELGWVGNLAPNTIRSTCVFCAWMWIDFELQVSVPPFTPTGTRDLVRILDGNQKLLTSFELIAEK